MLRKLLIRNYALIDSLDLEFENGLTIITGETGAGKSIMLGALSLLLGERADTRAISDGSEKSVVEAVFEGVSTIFKEYIAQNDLEWRDGEIIIRREISSNGRSRAFINDQPVTLAVLAGFSKKLIDIHSQHENASLNDNTTQLEIIDIVSDNELLRKNYREAFNKFVATRSEIKRLKEDIEKSKENRDFLLFQLEGLEALHPKRGELAEIEKRFELLSDADEIRDNLQEFCSMLGANETGVIEILSNARSIIEKMNLSLAENDGDEDGIPARLDNILIELKDIYDTADDLLSSVDSDPVRLVKLSQRMNAYYEAVKRFRVKDADELVSLYEDVKNRLNRIETGGEDLPELERRGKMEGKLLKELSDKLTKTRERGAELFSKEVMKAARPLGLPNLDFKVDISSGKLNITGQDKIEFLCGFNKNQHPGPISRMASGGEMSRLMLSIKGIMAGRMNLPTIIFDEVDTGVSGEIADKMGNMMGEMSENMQVITITHLPQVAVKGKTHFKVYKRDEEKRTVTRVMQLEGDERIREIAGMMSGSEVGEAALNNAKALLKNE